LPRRARSKVGLRGIVAGAGLAVAIMVLGVAGALVALTSSLHHATGVLRQAVRGVRLAQAAQIDLMLHAQSPDPETRAALAHDLREKLTDAEEVVTSDVETADLGEARTRVDAYLTAANDSDRSGQIAPLQAAFEALDALVRRNVSQADEAARDSAYWNRLGDVLGVSAGILMLAVLSAIVWWVRRAVVRPIFGLSTAVERFGIGDLDARAPAAGVLELQQLGAGFNEMAAAMARQHEARLRYLAGVAHDLRNPLAALQLSVSAIDPEEPLPSEEQVRHVLSISRRQVTRLNRMVSDLLDGLRIEAGHLSLHLEEVDVRGIAIDVADLFDRTSSLHDVDLDLPDEPLIVRCDPLRIEQALSNLVSNAIKYSPRGGEVRIAVRRHEGDAFLSVEDQGVGIPEADLAAIWEPFRRTGTSTEMIPGVGLGLSIAKRIIEAHRGEISVESTPGTGSTFTIRVPLWIGQSPRNHQGSWIAV
jgi:signal transduction histidine kinase